MLLRRLLVMMTTTAARIGRVGPRALVARPAPRADPPGQRRCVHLRLSRGDALLTSGSLGGGDDEGRAKRRLYNVTQAGSLGEESLESNCEEIVLGIDPDRSGAIAILKSTRVDDDGRGSGGYLSVQAQVIDVPVYRVAIGKTSKGRERIDAAQLALLIKDLNLPKDRTVAFLEGGGVEYHFSSYSAFVQGLGVGIWEGVLSHAEIPWHKINSKTWKTLFELVGTKEKGEEEASSREGEGDPKVGGEPGEKGRRREQNATVKTSSVALARQIFPELEGHLSPKGKHGRSDALLIASYGHLVRVQEGNAAGSTLKDVFMAAGLKNISSERLKLDLLTANELKVLLRDRKLKVSGKKGELIERLLQHSRRNDAKGDGKERGVA